MAVEKNRYLLSFTTSSGNLFQINIPKARKNMSAADVTTFMNALITNGKLYSSAGTPAGIKEAVLITTTNKKVE